MIFAIKIAPTAFWGAVGAINIALYWVCEADPMMNLNGYSSVPGMSRASTAGGFAQVLR